MWSKDFIDHKAYPLHEIVNQSLEFGKFPDNVKFSIIKQIFKKSERNKMENYCPMLLLSRFSKAFKLFVNKQLKLI